MYSGIQAKYISLTLYLHMLPENYCPMTILLKDSRLANRILNNEFVHLYNKFDLSHDVIWTIVWGDTLVIVINLKICKITYKLAFIFHPFIFVKLLSNENI